MEYVVEGFNNSAKRILNILNKLQNATSGDSAFIAWSKALDTIKQIPKKDPHELQRKLGLLKNELDLLEASMSSTEFSKPLYLPYIERIKTTVSITNLDSPWTNYVGQLGSDVILCIMFCSEILPSDPNVKFDELNELLNKIKSFREEISSNNLPPSTNRFVHSQLDIIENAILDFPIKGGIAVKQAFTAGLSDLSDKEDSLAKDEATLVISKVGTYWKDLKKAGDEFVATDRIVNALVGLTEKGQSLANSVIACLPPGTNS
jgi:hypothetical protein